MHTTHVRAYITGTRVPRDLSRERIVFVRVLHIVHVKRTVHKYNYTRRGHIVAAAAEPCRTLIK